MAQASAAHGSFHFMRVINPYTFSQSLRLTQDTLTHQQSPRIQNINHAQTIKLSITTEF